MTTENPTTEAASTAVCLWKSPEEALADLEDKAETAKKAQEAAQNTLSTSTQDSESINAQLLDVQGLVESVKAAREQVREKRQKAHGAMSSVRTASETVRKTACGETTERQRICVHDGMKTLNEDKQKAEADVKCEEVKLGTAQQDHARATAKVEETQRALAAAKAKLNARPGDIDKLTARITEIGAGLASDQSRADWCKVFIGLENLETALAELEALAGKPVVSSPNADCAPDEDPDADDGLNGIVQELIKAFCEWTDAKDKEVTAAAAERDQQAAVTAAKEKYEKYTGDGWRTKLDTLCGSCLGDGSKKAARPTGY